MCLCVERHHDKHYAKALDSILFIICAVPSTIWVEQQLHNYPNFVKRMMTLKYCKQTVGKVEKIEGSSDDGYPSCSKQQQHNGIALSSTYIYGLTVMMITISSV